MVSQQIKFNDWHRCRRYWKVELDCPFMRMEGHEEDDDQQDQQDRPPQAIPPAAQPRQPVAIPIPERKRNRRPVPIIVGKDDTLDDEANQETVKEVLRFPDLRENPFTDRPQAPIPIPGRKAASGLEPRPVFASQPPGQPSSPTQPPPSTPTPEPSPLLTRRGTLAKAATLETVYAQVLAQQSAPSPTRVPAAQPSPTSTALPSIRPNSQRSAQLAAFTQLRNSSVFISQIARGGSPQTTLFPPRGRPSTARSPQVPIWDQQGRRTSQQSRQQPTSTRRPFPIPLVPPTIGRGGRGARGGGGFNVNFSARLRALLGQRGAFGPAF